MDTNWYDPVSKNRPQDCWINHISDQLFFIISGALILVLTVIIYESTLAHEFTNWDDPDFIIDTRFSENMTRRSNIANEHFG
jgi:hypothetical protein